MEVYKQLFQEQLTDMPKKMLQKTNNGYDEEKGWVFLTNNFTNVKSVRTYKTLYAMSKDYTYYTPNSFYRNDKRNSGTLRWLNSFVVDIDVKNGKNEELILPELLENINNAGLPTPTLVVQTPSKGYHVYFHLQSPKRALPKVVRLYELILLEIAKEIDGDIQAVGAERWFRLPTESNIIYRSDNRISFSDMCDWLSIQRESETSNKTNINLAEVSLLNHPAVLKLLEGVSEGQRDNTCYTLALTFKASGISKEEAEERLYSWNENNEPKLTKMEIKRKVKSAYKPGSPGGPSSFWISELSGIKFTYRPMVGAKPREERKYSHMKEWKNDLITYLKKNKGEIIGSQREIASTVGIPYSSFKEVINLLINENRITKIVEGKGRAAKTTIKLTNIVPLIPRKENGIINGPNLNTFRDTVVGGLTVSQTASNLLDIYEYDSS